MIHDNLTDLQIRRPSYSLTSRGENLILKSVFLPGKMVPISGSILNGTYGSESLRVDDDEGLQAFSLTTYTENSEACPLKHGKCIHSKK